MKKPFYILTELIIILLYIFVKTLNSKIEIWIFLLYVNDTIIKSKMPENEIKIFNLKINKLASDINMTITYICIKISTNLLIMSASLLLDVLEIFHLKKKKGRGRVEKKRWLVYILHTMPRSAH